MIDLATWVPYLLTPAIGVAYLYRSRQLPRNRMFFFLGLALLASFLLTTGQLVLVGFGRTNVLIQYTWPMVTSILLLYGLAKLTSDATAGASMILILGFLLGVSADSQAAVLQDAALIRIVSATIVAWALYRSHYHRTGLEVGIWSYYLIPAPALVAGMVDPAVAVPVWLFSRVFQLLGLLVLGGWLYSRTRHRSGSPASPSSSASRSLSVGDSLAPLTYSGRKYSKSGKPTGPISESMT